MFFFNELHQFFHNCASTGASRPCFRILKSLKAPFISTAATERHKFSVFFFVSRCGVGAVALTGCLREEKNVNAPAAGKTGRYGIIKAKKGGRRKVEWKGWRKSLLSRLTNVATGCLQPREINHLASPLVRKECGVAAGKRRSALRRVETCHFLP